MDIPSLGPHGTPPPRADLPMPWAVEERHGWVWLAPERTTAPLPARPSRPRPSAAPAPPAPGRRRCSTTSTRRSSTPGTRSRSPASCGPAAGCRSGCWAGTGCCAATATAWPPIRPRSASGKRLGVIWLAPAEPADVPLEVPEAADRRFVAGWLPPVRSPGPAGPLADTFLDATHGPFVHARDHRRRGRREVAPGPVDDRAGRVQQRAGAVVRQPGRPRGRHRRAAAAPAPADHLHLPGAVPAAAAPGVPRLGRDDDDPVPAAARGRSTPRGSTSACCSPPGPGSRCHLPADVAAQVALQQQMLEEDVRAAGGAAPSAGLPLDLRDEVHVPADRLGVALRQALCDFAAVGRRRVGRVSSVVRELRAARRAAGRRVLVGQPSARRADAAQPSRPGPRPRPSARLGTRSTRPSLPPARCDVDRSNPAPVARFGWDTRTVPSLPAPPCRPDRRRPRRSRGLRDPRRLGPAHRARRAPPPAAPAGGRLAAVLRRQVPQHASRRPPCRRPAPATGCCGRCTRSGTSACPAGPIPLADRGVPRRGRRAGGHLVRPRQRAAGDRRAAACSSTRCGATASRRRRCSGPPACTRRRCRWTTSRRSTPSSSPTTTTTTSTCRRSGRC